MRLDRVEAINNQQLFGNQNVTFSTVEPVTADKVNGAMWFEPGAVFPQPWIYDSTLGVWFSSPYQLTLPPDKIYSNPYTWSTFGLYFYNVSATRTKFINTSLFIVNNVATAHTNANYYSITGYYLTSGVPIVETANISLVNNTKLLPANGNKRIYEALTSGANTPGNAWGWRFYAEAAGSPPGSITISGFVTIQSARP